jgi:hypothetical protein
MQISAFKCNAINIEVAEAEEKKEAKEKQMLLKILTSNGINLKEAENFAKYYIQRGRQNLSDVCLCNSSD